MSAPARPDPGEQECSLGGGCAQAHVAGQRHHGAGAGADAVDGADHGLRAIAHGLDEVAGHAGELKQLGHGHLGQRADDLVHVTTGAEVAAGAGDYHRLDIDAAPERLEQLTEFGIGLEGQRVLAFRPVQGDGAHAAFACPRKMARLVGRGGLEAGVHRIGSADVVFHGTGFLVCDLRVGYVA
jgi:hypothetical protein